MALDPQNKDILARFTMAAKKLIYNPEMMKEIMGMLGTKEGAVMAVHSIMAAIEKQKPIPPQVYGLLGVNIYIAAVDVAQAVTKAKPDPEIMNAVIKQILSETKPADPGQPQAVQPPQGIVASQLQGAPA